MSTRFPNARLGSFRIFEFANNAGEPLVIPNRINVLERIMSQRGDKMHPPALCFGETLGAGITMELRQRIEIARRKEHGSPPYLASLECYDCITRGEVVSDETIDILAADIRLVGHHKNAGLIVSVLC